jgi:hypothetical protein
MGLLDYKKFLINESVKADATFDAQDIVNAVQKLAKKVVVKEGKSVFEIWVYLDDRDSQSKKIDDVLTSNGIQIQKVQRAVSKGSLVTEFTLDGKAIRLVFKPIGGNASTTLHSTITELVPILLWKAGYNGSSDADTMLSVCKEVDLNSITWAGPKDAEAAAKYLDMFDDAPLYKEKMENAYGIYQWLKQTPTTEIIWCYRTKPFNLPSKSRADIVVVPTTGDPYGVSLKAKSASGKVRKMSSTFPELCRFIGGSVFDDAISWGWDAIYSQYIKNYIAEVPESADELNKINAKNYWSPGSKSPEQKKMVEVLDYYYAKNKNSVDESYYKLQTKVKDIICGIVTSDTANFIAFLKDKIGIGSAFPVRVVEAKKTNAVEIHEDTEDSIAATFAETPVTAADNPSSPKRFSIKFGTTEFVYDVWNSQGGNKTAGFFNFVIAQIG